MTNTTDGGATLHPNVLIVEDDRAQVACKDGALADSEHARLGSRIMRHRNRIAGAEGIGFAVGLAIGGGHVEQMDRAVAHQLVARAVEGDAGVVKTVAGAFDETAAMHEHAVIARQPA